MIKVPVFVCLWHILNFMVVRRSLVVVDIFAFIAARVQEPQPRATALRLVRGAVVLVTIRGPVVKGIRVPVQ